MTELAANLDRIRERIRVAATGAGRAAAEVVLVAVTKKVAPETVDAALSAGLEIFGESKVQEAKAKIPLVSSRAHWHFIGHLQTNKARDAVALFDLIHSVDSLHLAEELHRAAERAGKTQRVLLEVNCAGEKSKYGFAVEDVAGVFPQIQRLTRLQVEGLMTIAPYTEDAAKVRPYFRRLRELRDQLRLRELSMGMSGDFEVAIEEGATMVRVGTAIFGERKQHEPTE